MLFQSGAIRGDMKQVKTTLDMAQSIERKFQPESLDNED